MSVYMYMYMFIFRVKHIYTLFHTANIVICYVLSGGIVKSKFISASIYVYGKSKHIDNQLA